MGGGDKARGALREFCHVALLGKKQALHLAANCFFLSKLFDWSIGKHDYDRSATRWAPRGRIADLGIGKWERHVAAVNVKRGFATVPENGDQGKKRWKKQT